MDKRIRYYKTTPFGRDNVTEEICRMFDELATLKSQQEWVSVEIEPKEEGFYLVECEEFTTHPIIGYWGGRAMRDEKLWEDARTINGTITVMRYTTLPNPPKDK